MVIQIDMIQNATVAFDFFFLDLRIPMMQALAYFELLERSVALEIYGIFALRRLSVLGKF